MSTVFSQGHLGFALKTERLDSGFARVAATVLILDLAIHCVWYALLPYSSGGARYNQRPNRDTCHLSASFAKRGWVRAAKHS